VPWELVLTKALVVIDEWLADYQRAGERGTVEAQLDIIWPTTGTPNRTEAPEDRCFRMIGSQPTGVRERCRDRATTTYNLLDFNGTDSPFLIL
jgi:hypothetical protein